ncbi:MAG: amidohydrolase family protein [Bacteroidota bacterium]
MKFIRFVSLVLFVLGCQTQNPNEPEFTLIKGATLFDGNGNRLEKSQILIRNGKIVSIHAAEAEVELTQNTKMIDASGQFIMPGLVDAHVHLTLSGFYDTRPEYVDLTSKFPYHEVLAQRKEMAYKYLDSYLHSGVTAIYDLGSETWTYDLQQLDTSDHPHVAATGPLISHYPDPGVIDKIFISPDSPADARLLASTLTAHGATGIKFWRLDWENEEFMQSIQALVDEANERNNHVIFHIAKAQEVRDAIALGGETIITHLPQDEVLDEKTLKVIVEQKIIQIPTLTVRKGYLKTIQGLLGEAYFIENPNNTIDDYTWSIANNMAQYKAYIDSVSIMGMFRFWSKQNSDSIEKIRAENLRRLHKAGAIIAVGSDAGNPIIFHGPAIYDELEAVQKAGIPPMDLITMVTKNGAKAMKKEAEIGTLEAGKAADLLILDKDPSLDISNVRSISRIMKKGKFIQRKPVNDSSK